MAPKGLGLATFVAALCGLCAARDSTFTIRLASGKSDCFYEYIHEGAFLEVEYQVSGQHHIIKGWSRAFGRDRGHKVVTETLARSTVSQDISGSGHGVIGIFLGGGLHHFNRNDSLTLHTYSHASKEHVCLIMRVEHRLDRLAH